MSFQGAVEVAGCRVLVCGAGAAALAPITRLLDSGALVTVFGTDVSATVSDLASRSLITLRPPATGRRGSGPGGAPGHRHG